MSPVAGALRSLTRQMEGEKPMRVSARAPIEMARLLPELDPHRGMVPARAGAHGNGLLALEFGVVQRRAMDGALKLLIEARHWADRSTLDLLREPQML